MPRGSRLGALTPFRSTGCNGLVCCDSNEPESDVVDERIGRLNGRTTALFEAEVAVTGVDSVDTGTVRQQAIAPELLRSRLIREVSVAEAHMSLLFSMLMWVAGIIAVGAVLILDASRVARAPLIAALVIAAVGFMLDATARLADLVYLRRWYGPVYLLQGGLALVAISLAVHGSRAVVPEAAAFYLQATVLCYFTLRRSVAAAATLLACAAYLVVLLITADFSTTLVLRWLCIALPVITISTLLGPQAGIAARSTRAAEAAQAALADANQRLEQRVAEQVAEIERARALRSFLSPAVADVVMGNDALLAPHRREVAVFFSDLRGFTAFTSRTEPEEVVEVLSEYYEAVGEVLRRHGATIGSYAGDGIMAYVGDPLPVSGPAEVALRMAREARDVGRVLSARWRARGHDLGLGIGVALGYATLGVVGSTERRDYTALGSVVNLAARLCSEAGDGEVLVDQRAAAGQDMPIRGPLTLKGFGEVAVHLLP